MKKTKTSLLHSGLALLLCISMLIGSTFAWFSDSISSGKNIITAGNLDLEMYWTDDLDSGVWHNVEENGHNTIFSYDNWEPGYTDVKYIKLVNVGELALNYKLSLTPQNGVGKLAEVINVYFAEGGVAVEQRSDLKKLRAIGLLNNVLDGGATADGTLLAKDQYSPLHPSGEVVMTVAMNMLTTAGNEYMNEDAGLFSITALATQAPFEKDSFGDDYDSKAEYPTILQNGSATGAVAPVDGKVPAGGVTLTGGNISAFIPEGVAVEDGTTELKLTVTPLKNTTSDITTVNNEILIPVDVHIKGVAEDNTVPIIIDLGEVLPKYLNMGNYRLYHVEDGTNNEMVLVDDKASLVSHNQFTYDTLTGAVSVAMASFSEVALVADTSKAWEGEEDYSWYNTTDKTLHIANADQLHAFAKIVGGMAADYGIDSFSDKTVILLSDINLHHGTVLPDEENTTTTIFYPIGYSNNSEFTSGNEVNRPTETKTGVTSEVNVFKGTFDGNGHTIANFYQNTWEMFGDYNSGYPANSNYYKDAMGLFAWVDGTVKNLTVDNFESDGEFTPTGVIAAYAGYNGNATFENIAITNCNPRVYNTGNGGIVGIGGNEEKENAISFKNITIDNSNKITALWGSWDVACGGLMGMFRGKDSDKAVVTMNNCHVAAQIDVYNDVCGNYQYYWYRYSGMLVGTNYNMTTENGYTVPNTKQYSAENCTVHFGDWNDYYYCELVANSLASYTHDHQFSRLEQIQNVSEIQDENGNWKTTGNFILMNGKTPTKTCYHIMKDAEGKLYEHKHDVKDDTNKDIYETTDINGDGVVDSTVLKENNQRVYLPFNQLFTGYGWGVKHIPIYDDDTSNPFAGVTILDREVADSVEKFETKFTGDFLYRVGNENAVSVGSLFEYKDSIAEKDRNGSSVWVSVESVYENSTVNGTFTPSKTNNWEDGTIVFSNTGVVKVTIQDYNFCTPTVIYLEVVDATNVTKATSATSNSIVLLNNVSGSFSVSNNHTLYGNGFTVTLPTSYEAKSTAGFVGYITMNNGNLDNVRIEGPVYPVMNIYQSQSINNETQKEEYFYNSILINGGNCTISNSYISGSRTAVCIRGGNNVVVENTTLSGGAFANMQVAGVNSLVLRDLTTVQEDVIDSYGKGITAHGMGIYVDSAVANITVEGSLNQYNWLSQTQWKAIVGTYESFFPAFFSDAKFEPYQGKRDNTTYVNIAFVFACDWNAAKLNVENQTSKLPYQKLDGITVKTPEGSVTGGVYSVVNQKTVTDDMYYAPSYKSTGYNPVAPTFDWDNSVNHDDNDDANANDSYCVYNQDTGVMSIGLTGNKTLNLSGVSITKGGAPINYTAYLNGNKISGNTVTITADSGTTQTLTFNVALDGKGYDKNGNVISGNIEYVWNVTLEVATLSYPAPEWAITNNKPSTTNCYYVYYTTSKGYGEAVPIYDGIVVKYYDTNGVLQTKDFSKTIAELKGKGDMWNLNTELVHEVDGCKLTMKVTGSFKSGVTGLYFTTYNDKTYVYPADLKSDSWVRPKTTSYAFNVSVEYTFTDPHGLSTPKTTVNWYADAGKTSNTVQWKTFDRDNGQTQDCITPDTLVTLADGSQKRVDALNGNEELLVWNHETGKLDRAPVAYIVDHNGVVSKREIINLNFANGKTVKIIGEHVFFDATQNKYVAINSDNADALIGHTFAGLNADGTTIEKVELVSVDRTTEETILYEVVSYKHLTCFTEGILSTSAFLDSLLNVFDINTDTLAYDIGSVAGDIEFYGLYTYADFDGLISEDAFELYNAKYLKIAVGKGYITWDDILALIDIYFNVEVQPIK